MTTKKLLFPVNSPHLDAAESVFFSRELESIMSEQFDVKKVGLMARRLLPVDNTSVDRGAQSFTYSSYDGFGKAKRISDYSDDLPVVNVAGNQTTGRLQSYGDAFVYSIDEIAAAAMARKPLERMRADQARKVLDLQLDDIAAVGDLTAGLRGLLNQLNTSTATPVTKGAGGTTWAVATADEILADLNAMISTVIVNTKETERPTRIVLPTAQYELISTKARSTTSDTTILKYFQGNRHDVEVMSWERLAGAGAGGTDRAIAYDPRATNVRLIMPIEFEQLAPQQVNMAFKVLCRFKTGGVIAPYPKSILYMDGI